MNVASDLELHARPAGPDSVALIERARAGDTGAFAELYRGHHRRIYALCLRLTADVGRAEELTQDTFVHAWQSLERFRGAAQFSTWLHRIAVNTVLSEQRRHGRWFGWLRDMPEEAPELADPSTPAGLSLDLETAIARLPARARQVFVLVDVEGYSHEEAAAALAIAVGTSKAHLFRARSLLRGMLS